MPEQLGSAHANATPLWFGPGERPLFGWLHLPLDGVARGGVVLCPPLGIEAVCVYFSYRALADRLSELGLAVLRFDYDGTGDSVGQETDPDRLEAWLGSVAAATDRLVQTGVGSVGLVGIRIGALFAASEAARRGGVDALALWDPCLSGRAFLREQQFLRRIRLTETDRGDQAIETPGIRFESETVTDLSGLELARLEGTLADRVLVLVPPGRSRPRALERRLQGVSVDWQEATGEDLLLDSQMQEPPYETIERVAVWLSETVQSAPVGVDPPHGGPVAVDRTPSGRPVFEGAVRLGPLGLFGIVTEGAETPGSPTVVLVNEGNTHHIGQARIWVDLARRLGTEGFRVLRFDLSGNGDSGTRPGQTAHVARAPEAMDDLTEAMRAISPEDPANVVLVGFCSGAYQIAEQTAAIRPRGACVINPSFSFFPPEPAGTYRRPARQATRRWFATMVKAPLRLAAHRIEPRVIERLVTVLDLGTWPAAVAVRRPSIPDPMWWVVNRTLLENLGVATLEHMVAEGVDTFLICGPRDLLAISLGSEGRVRKLEQSEQFRLAVMEGLDHSLWEMDQRQKMIDLVSGYLRERHRSGESTRVRTA